MKPQILFFLFSLFSLTVQGQSEWSIDSIARHLDFTYKPLQGYTQTSGELIFKTPKYPDGLERDFGAKWTSKDDECIVFLDDGGASKSIADGFLNKIDKSKTEIHDATYNRISNYMKISKFGSTITSSQFEEMKKRTTLWTEKKAKAWFNAHHVIEFPGPEQDDTIYEEKYYFRRCLCIIKWEKYIEINFLVTEKGYKNIDKYINGVKKAFWFDD